MKWGVILLCMFLMGCMITEDQYQQKSTAVMIDPNLSEQQKEVQLLKLKKQREQSKDFAMGFLMGMEGNARRAEQRQRRRQTRALEGIQRELRGLRYGY